MFGTYIAIYVKYMYKQHQLLSLTCDTSVNILTCVYTSMIHTMYIIKISLHTWQIVTNKIINAVFKYIHVYYTCDKFK